jgi:hypothetical protein
VCILSSTGCGEVVKKKKKKERRKERVPEQRLSIKSSSFSARSTSLPFTCTSSSDEHTVDDGTTGDDGIIEECETGGAVEEEQLLCRPSCCKVLSSKYFKQLTISSIEAGGVREREELDGT